MKENKKSKFDEAINFIILIIIGTILAQTTTFYFWFTSGLIALMLLYLLAYIKKWKHQNRIKTSIGVIFGGFVSLLIVIAFIIIIELNKIKNSKLSSLEELEDISFNDLKEKFFLRDGFIGIEVVTEDNKNLIKIYVNSEEAFYDILGYMTYQGYNKKIYTIIIK